MSGNLAAQVIAVGSVPILTRLFSPEEFGLFALFMAFLRIISKIGTLGYERAALLPKDATDARAVVMLSALILICMAALAGIFGMVFGEEIAQVLGSPEFSAWLLIIPVGLLLIGATNILRYWALREQMFRLISATRVTDAAVAAASKIVFGFLLGNWSGGLIVGALAGNAVALVLLLRYLHISRDRDHMPPISLENIKIQAYQYRQFPLFAAPNALLNTMSRYLAVFFLSAFYGPAVVGFYNLAHRTLVQPIDTLAGSIARVYFQRSADQVSSSKHLMPDLKKVIAMLFLIGIGPCIILLFFGRQIITFVFGAEWDMAGIFVQIMAPWFIFLFVIAPAAMVFEVCHRQQVKFRINISTTVLSIMALWWFYSLGQPLEIVLGAFVGVNSVMSIIQLVMAFRVARQHDSRLAVINSHG